MRRRYPTLHQPERSFSSPPAVPLAFPILRGKHPRQHNPGPLDRKPLLKPEVAYEWSYGAVYSPKWIRGLTLRADFWHIDLRSLAALSGGTFIVEHENLFPGNVIRDPTTGAITDIINPNLNLSGAVVEGLDYEAIYILDSGFSVVAILAGLPLPSTGPICLASSFR